MALTPQDVRDKTFTSTRFRLAYNEDEVDAFLDEVEAELIRLYAENEELRSKLAAAQATRVTQPEPAPVQAAPAPTTPSEPDDDVLSRTLLMAQKTADDMVAQSRDEAARLVAEAMERAVALERQASEQQQAVLERLTDERGKLEAQIEQLRAFEREYRTRLKAYLEMQLRELVGSTPATEPEAGPEAADQP